MLIFAIIDWLRGASIWTSLERFIQLRPFVLVYLITAFTLASDAGLDSSVSGAHAGSLKPEATVQVEKKKFDLENTRDAAGEDKNSAIFCNLKAALVVDNATGNILYSQRATEIRPFASISKLLTAVTLLNMPVNWDSLCTVTKEDGYRSSTSVLKIGDKVLARDLLKVALIGSDNRAARCLARTFAGSYEDFAISMNDMAEEIGLEQTSVVEPTGLDERNQSSAFDCALLSNHALGYSVIVDASKAKRFTFKVITKRGKTIHRRIVTTNRMVYSKYRTLVAKTGYIQASDYCLTTTLQNSAGDRVTVVALGAPRNSVRFKEVRRLADFGFGEIARHRKAS